MITKEGTPSIRIVSDAVESLQYIGFGGAVDVTKVMRKNFCYVTLHSGELVTPCFPQSFAEKSI
jgi:hypothetical protein